MLGAGAAATIAYLDATPEAISIWLPRRDDDGRISDLTSCYVNPAAAAMSPLAVADYLGTGMREVYPDAVAIFTRCVRTLETGEPSEEEFDVDLEFAGI